MSIQKGISGYEVTINKYLLFIVCLLLQNSLKRVGINWINKYRKESEMNGRENTTNSWVQNATLDSSTENKNTTIVEFTYTSVTPVGHYQCENYDLFMGFFVKVCFFFFCLFLKRDWPGIFHSFLHQAFMQKHLSLTVIV